MRIIARILILFCLLSLCGCSVRVEEKLPANDTEPAQTAALIHSKPKATNHPKATAGPQDAPIQETAETPLPTAAPVPAATPAPDPSMLVTDAHAETFGQRSFAIPVIHWQGQEIEAINREIWSKFYEELLTHVKYDYEELGYVDGMEYVRYEWSVHDDVLHLLISYQPDSYHDPHFTVYRVDLKRSQRLGTPEFLDRINLDPDEYRAILMEVLAATLEERAYPDLAQECRDKTLAEENIALSEPFLNTQGQLCSTALIYTPAGAGQYWEVIPLPYAP